MIVLDAALAVLEPEAVAVHLEDVNVVGKTIEQRVLWSTRTPLRTRVTVVLMSDKGEL